MFELKMLPAQNHILQIVYSFLYFVRKIYTLTFPDQLVCATFYFLRPIKAGRFQ
jgi:hypothetical protein